jgi:hypothetical protein
MHHIHLGQCPSTQDILKGHLLGSDFKEVLISCDRQIAGIGREGKTWIQGKNSLAFSFSLRPNPVISLTSLEIGILISRFFKTNFHQDIKLKWMAIATRHDPYRLLEGFVVYFSPCHAYPAVGTVFSELFKMNKTN